MLCVSHCTAVAMESLSCLEIISERKVEISFQLRNASAVLLLVNESLCKYVSPDLNSQDFSWPLCKILFALPFQHG